MKKVFVFLVITFAADSLIFGQQHFKFKYKIYPSFSKHGQLFEVYEDQSGRIKTWTHFVEDGKGSNSDTLSVFTYIPKITYAARTIPERVSGKITLNETKDTFTLVPWYRKNKENFFGAGMALDPDNNYVFAIAKSKWSISKAGNPYIDIPFVFTELTSTSLPFRVNLRNGDVTGEFLNANLALFRVWGKTRFYRSKFIDARDRYLGVGVYIGGSEIEEEEKKLFGFNYGLNAIAAIYKVQIIVALGAESGISSKANKFNPYLGVGFGVSISDFFSPSADE